MLHTKFESSGPCGFGEEDFFMFSNCNSIGAKDPWGGAIFYPSSMVGLVVSEKKIFFVFPMKPPGQGLYGPQGHGWQDL